MVRSVLSLAPACLCFMRRQLQGPRAKAPGSEKQLSCVLSKNEECNILVALSSGLWEEATWGRWRGQGATGGDVGTTGQSPVPSSPLRLAGCMNSEKWLFSSAPFPSCTFPHIQLCVNPFSSPGSQHQHPNVFSKHQPWLFFVCHPAPRAFKRPSSWKARCAGEWCHLLAVGSYCPHSQSGGCLLTSRPTVQHTGYVTTGSMTAS